ncbi:MAG: acetylornithine/N-succinyldiaminopimelate aminotransferase [Rhodocyclaceae bacterium]|nr:MAG: acetylornithine/N-succinyldiaminopimelate aminotransferase [Rhodocyclaceae bacterium]TND01517.1 MAG: acetylornithine/N-succinyldiaminopimelate aminotransferase [Rhodocyclaceae bacterium]
MNAVFPQNTSLMRITERPDLVFSHGSGSWLTDEQGKRYLDFVQGWAANCLGHAPAAVLQALNEQSSRLVNPSPAFYNRPSIELAECLTKHSVFDQVFFANSGAEANEGAIKLARKWGRRHKAGAFEIITFENSFHGRTLATMSASGKPGWDKLFAPQVDGFPKAKLNDIDSVTALITSNTAAIMLELVQGEAGVIPATYEFIHSLRELANLSNVLLIVDEVQTGIGRTGKLFAYEHLGIVPDIMTLGKGIGGGIPLAALLAREEVCCFEVGDQGGTFNGNPLTTAVGVAVLNTILTPGFLGDVASKGDYLAARLKILSTNFGLPGERGVGLLRGLVLTNNCAGSIVLSALQRAPDGLLLNAPRPNLLRFMPALTVTHQEIDLMVEWLTSILDDSTALHQ